MNLWFSLYSFASTMSKFLIRKSHILQDSHSKKIHIDLNNLHSNLRLCENVSSFHPNNQDEIRKAYLQRVSCQPLGHVSLKKKKN